MRRRRAWVVAGVVVAVLVVLAALPTPAPAPAAVEARTLPSGSFAIEGVRVFDGETTIEATTVVVRDGAVVAIGGQVPEGLPVIDGTTRTLLPGLIDAHTHSWGDALERALVFGVTTHLDQFGSVTEAMRLEAEQEQGAWTRADLISAGTLVTAPGGHGTQFGLPIPTLTSAADADQFVADRLAEGSAWIKLVIEDGSELGISLPTLDAATVAAVVQAAHAREALVVAHVHSLAAARMAVAAGIDGLVHTVFDELPDEAFARELLERGVFVVPTLSVMAGLDPARETPRPGTGAALAADQRLAPWLFAREKTSLAAGMGFGAAGAFDKSLESVRRWHAAGVTILVGTDVGNPSTSPGASVHGELELLVAAGLSPAEALAGATALAAKEFRVPGRGRLAVGSRADLVLVEGNPLADITATRAIVGVWKGGRLVDRPVPAAEATPKLPAEPELISDFAEDLGTSLGGVWTAATDERMGGTSVVELSHAAGDPGLMRVRGELRPGFAFPWAGAMLFFGAQPMEAVDLGDRTTVVVRARGTAIRVTVLADGLPRPVETRLPAAAEWQEHRIDLVALGVPSASVQGLLLGGVEGAFAFEVDRVDLVAAAR